MTETILQLDILTEVHKVRSEIYRMAPKEREELMRNAEEIAQLLNQGSVKRAKEKLIQLTMTRINDQHRLSVPQHGSLDCSDRLFVAHA